jgi:type I restriction enzyme S subunit
MSEWKEYKLGDLGAFFGGVTTIKREDYGFGTPFITYKNVYKNSRIDTSILELMNVRKNDIIKRNCIYGDIFFTASSETPDEVAMSSVLLANINDLTFNGFCKRYRLYDFNTLIPEYARYLFRGEDFRNSAYEYANGDVRFNISQESLSKISITIPDLPTQTAIAEILSSLDDKIELNNKINQDLENLAQTLFKQWFIDFEFPNENGEPYKSSGGEMVESELGEIPKGWQVGTLSEILDVKGGTTPSTKEEKYWNGCINWTSPRDLSNLKFPLLIDTEKKITELGLSKISSGLLPKDTLLLSSRAPIGYLAITNIETAINQGYIAINGKGGYSNIYILYWLKANMNLVVERANGSTFLEISKSNFKQINCVVPALNSLNSFTSQAHILFDQLRNNILENQQLTTLRDILLPKLISGELEISPQMQKVKKENLKKVGIEL